MDILRTPDARFDALPDCPYAPRYVDVRAGDGSDVVRVAYLDEGPRDAPVVLMLHGEPSWSFLYRKVIATVVGFGLRAVAPDLVGFGRSDKPVRREDYTYQRHVDWMRAFVENVDLRSATLLCQDWGGLIGLRLVAEMGERFDRVVAANTFLPTGDEKVRPAFLAWQQFSQSTPTFPVGKIVATGCARALPDDVVAAYDAPFPDDEYKVAARVFPSLVPTSTDDPAHADNEAAWKVLRAFDKPFLCTFSDGDPITRGGERQFIGHVPGTAGQPHTTIEGGGHFLQEDKGEVLAHVIADWLGGATA